MVAPVTSPLAGGISGDAALHGGVHASDAESQLVALCIGCLAALALDVAASQWQTDIVSLAVGVLLANVFYRAAITQTTELARNIWVGVDLYRSEIMRRMNVEMPSDPQEERALATTGRAVAEPRTARGYAKQCGWGSGRNRPY